MRVQGGSANYMRDIRTRAREKDATEELAGELCRGEKKKESENGGRTVYFTDSDGNRMVKVMSGSGEILKLVKIGHVTDVIETAPMV